MRRLSVLLLAACALLVSGWWVTAPPASACSCVATSTAEQVAAADAVFTGTLLSREVQHPAGPVWSSDDPAVHLFAVDTLYKGTASAQQEVVSADSAASCGLELRGDGPFLVLATAAPGGGLTTSLCGGSAPLSPQLEVEVQALVALPEGLPLTYPETTLAVPVGEPQPLGMTAAGSSRRTVLALEVGAGLVALLAGVLVVRSRRPGWR